MGPRVIDAGHQKADAVGPFAVELGVCLGTLADLADDAFERDRSAVGHF